MRKVATFLVLVAVVSLVFGAALRSGVSLPYNNVYAQSIESVKDTPNVIFILSDNQAASLLGAYGNKDIKTPNIDRLASDGIKFTRAYATNGLCSPTRASILTALMPSQHGLHDALHDDKTALWPKEWNAIQEFTTIPTVFKDKGYDTTLIGKWHLGQPLKAAGAKIGFDDWVTFSQGHTLDFFNNTIIDNNQTYKLENKHVVDLFTDKAVQYIEDHNDKKPFFMYLAYDAPYMLPPSNFGPQPQNSFYKDYVNSTFQSFPRLPPSDAMLGYLNGSIGGSSNPAAAQISAVYYHLTKMLNDPESMATMAANNAIVDDGVGKVMNALKQKGILNNTLVIYSSDQGVFFGQQGLMGHSVTTLPTSPYDVVMNIPLIIAHPGHIKPNQTIDMLISEVDLAPTIAEYAGFKDVQFKNSPGKSLASVLRGGTIGNWTDEVYFDDQETRAITTKDFAYWKRVDGLGTSAFYVLSKDPGQLKNEINNPQYASMIKELDNKVTEFFKTFVDKKYDLWNGGSSKDSVWNPDIWKKVNGPIWSPIQIGNATGNSTLTSLLD
ncbi:MAG: sulfatase family protein [Nitrososphaeraceae archaeon]